MVERSGVVMLNSGLHARPAATFVQKANQYTCDIHLIKKDKQVNAKSILGVMSLVATKGTELIIRANGLDENEAIDELFTFLSQEEES